MGCKSSCCLRPVSNNKDSIDETDVFSKQSGANTPNNSYSKIPALSVENPATQSSQMPQSVGTFENTTMPTYCSADSSRIPAVTNASDTTVAIQSSDTKNFSSLNKPRNNIQLTDSQVAFFQMLDDKIERGRDYKSDETDDS